MRPLECNPHKHTKEYVVLRTELGLEPSVPVTVQKIMWLMDKKMRKESIRRKSQMFFYSTNYLNSDA